MTFCFLTPRSLLVTLSSCIVIVLAYSSIADTSHSDYSAAAVNDSRRLRRTTPSTDDPIQHALTDLTHQLVKGADWSQIQAHLYELNQQELSSRSLARVSYFEAMNMPVTENNRFVPERVRDLENVVPLAVRETEDLTSVFLLKFRLANAQYRLARQELGSNWTERRREIAVLLLDSLSLAQNAGIPSEVPAMDYSETSKTLSTWVPGRGTTTITVTSMWWGEPTPDKPYLALNHMDSSMRTTEDASPDYALGSR